MLGLMIVNFSALQSHIPVVSLLTVLHDILYTVGHKKRATFIFTITLANVDRFQ